MLRTAVSSANGAGEQPSRAGRNIVAVAGLPARQALIHVLLFAAAFCFYGALWSKAPATQPDSGSYLRLAQDLSDFHIDRAQERTPGYPVLLLLTGSSQSPNRGLFYVSLALHFASIWLLASVLWRAGLSGRKVTLFSLILLLPPFVEPAAYVLTETLAEAMLAANKFLRWYPGLKGLFVFFLPQ